MDQYIPDRCRVDTSLPAHSRPGACATYSAQIAYRENLSGRDKKKMNRVPVIAWNPPYLEELEPEGEVVPVDPATFISGSSQIITAPASEDGDVVEEVVEEHDDEDLPQTMKDMYDFLGELSEKIQSFNSTMKRSTNPGQPPVVPDDVPKVDVWDTGKAIEQELRLFPNPTRKGLKDRLDNQVWDLLQLIQERVDQGTYNDRDIRLVDGLHVISVLHARLGILTEIALKHRAKKP